MHTNCVIFANLSSQTCDFYSNLVRDWLISLFSEHVRLLMFIPPVFPKSEGRKHRLAGISLLCLPIFLWEVRLKVSLFLLVMHLFRLWVRSMSWMFVSVIFSLSISIILLLEFSCLFMLFLDLFLLWTWGVELVRS